MRDWDVSVTTKGGTRVHFKEKAVTEFSAGNQITTRMNLSGGLWIDGVNLHNSRVWINRDYIETIAVREVNHDREL